MERSASPAYFSALHDEAFSLLIEARNYIASERQQGSPDSYSKSDYLDITLETMRLTTRLTQVMAWILAQKAVQSRELTPEQGASRLYQLSGQSVCLDSETGQAPHIPPMLSDLLRRSFDLYCRVNRLESQIGVRLAAGEHPKPLPNGERPNLRPVTTSVQNPQNAY
jgi:regulator of CtrA degradation